MRVIKKACSYLLAIIVFVFLVLALIVMLPFDFMEYRKSPYYKNTKEKYSFFAATGKKFELYNLIAENKLPIRFIKNSQVESIECGYFLLKDILIIPYEMPFEYNSLDKQWSYTVWDDEDEDGDGKRTIFTLDEYIDMEVFEINRIMGEPVCNCGVVLFDCKDSDYQEQAEQEPRFIVYCENLAEALTRFCNSEENVKK